MLCFALMLGAAGCGSQHSPLWDKPPLLLSEPAPEFSERVQYAQVRLLVDAEGNVAQAELVGEPRGYRGQALHSGVDGEIVALVKRYKFKPAQQGGRCVAAELIMEVNVDYF